MVIIKSVYRHRFRCSISESFFNSSDFIFDDEIVHCKGLGNEESTSFRVRNKCAYWHFMNPVIDTFDWGWSRFNIPNSPIFYHQQQTTSTNGTEILWGILIRLKISLLINLKGTWICYFIWKLGHDLWRLLSKAVWDQGQLICQHKLEMIMLKFM